MAGKGKSGGSRGASGKSYRSASTGRYVKKATADRHPGKTVGEARRSSGSSKSASKGGKNYRSASTGRYVKESTARRNPGGTVGEQR
jgi:hypothetical protein